MRKPESKEELVARRRLEKRVRRRVLAEVVMWLEQESAGLHVREAQDDDGLQRAIRVIREMERKNA